MRTPEPLACLLCGREADDVKVDLVEVEHPERMVDVLVPSTHRRDAQLMTLTVPERFYPVPRCRDRVACAGRERLASASFEAATDRVRATLEDDAGATERADALRAFADSIPVDDDDPTAFL